MKDRGGPQLARFPRGDARLDFSLPAGASVLQAAFPTDAGIASTRPRFAVPRSRRFG